MNINKIVIIIAMVLFFLNDVLQPMLGEDPYGFGTGIAGILLCIGILGHWRETEKV
ncbi:hypothetical protein [Peribacillus butanolivorans]|uniref:hypothetical protein n=1 Tax=Peribacillus butanolivorans TaxID=421767 RepID=UPI00159682D0|nr:hypothetical protein [Peribacillus butanolivorans]